MNETGQGRRSDFLVFIALLANGFLVACVADAILSLLDNLFLASSTDSAFFALLAVVGVMVLVLALLMVFAVILVPPLPKLVLLPPLVTLVWEVVGAPPIHWSLADQSGLALVNAVQLAVGIGAFAIARLTTGAWFLAASRMPRKRNLVLRTLIALPIAMVAAIAFVGVGVVAILAFVVEDRTGGYLHFAANGIEVRETVMGRDDKTVHLIATVHFADPRFYRELYAGIPNDALILAEGVTDREGRLKRGVSYGNAAQALGLQTQDALEMLMGPAVQDEEATSAKQTPSVGKPGNPLPPARGVDGIPKPKERPDVVRADLDVSEFSPLTIGFIDRVGEVYSSRSFSEAMERLSAVSREFSEAEIRSVMDDLIYKRNNRALAEFDKRLPHYRVVYVPWGAEHMRDFELALKERGFRIASQRMIPLAQYRTIFNALFASGRGGE